MHLIVASSLSVCIGRQVNSGGYVKVVKALRSNKVSMKHLKGIATLEAQILIYMTDNSTKREDERNQTVDASRRLELNNFLAAAAVLTPEFICYKLLVSGGCSD